MQVKLFIHISMYIIIDYLYNLRYTCDKQILVTTLVEHFVILTVPLAGGSGVCGESNSRILSSLVEILYYLHNVIGIKIVINTC